MNIPITPRLLRIARYVDKDTRLADIGTDHAYVPIYLVQTGVIKQAVAADINSAPLEKASENIKKAGLEDSIKTVLSDGFLSIEENSFDTAVIAGMGGMLIAAILGKAPRGKKYILQPMKNCPELKKYLSENGFIITAEGLAAEDGKLYNILVAEDGAQKLTDAELYIGKGLLKDPLLPEYKKELRRKLRKRINGLKSAEEPDLAELQRCEKLLELT